jgi:hypothetical protein
VFLAHMQSYPFHVYVTGHAVGSAGLAVWAKGPRLLPDPYIVGVFSRCGGILQARHGARRLT